MSEGTTVPDAPSSAARWRDLLSAGWRDQLSAANAVVRAVNTATGASWRLDSRFATGLLDGAWRVRDGTDVAVLKWHAPGSPTPYNPDAPAIAEFLRGAGYPTPRWLAWGTTPDGVAWSVQEFADGQPLRQLDIACADIFLDLVRLERTLTPPTNLSWNPYMRDHVFGDHERHRRLGDAGDDLRALLDQALELATPYESANLHDAEMVHFDLNVSNILVRNGGSVTVVDIDGTGRGCAVYDLLSPAINGVLWGSDPRAVERLVAYGLENYEPGAFVIAAACLTIELADWYSTTGSAHIEDKVARHRAWLADIRSRIR